MEILRLIHVKFLVEKVMIKNERNKCMFEYNSMLSYFN